MENFCHLVIEDFLTKSGMSETLRSFRSEWQRPAEVSHPPCAPILLLKHLICTI